MKMPLFASGVPYQRLLVVNGGVQRYRMLRYVMVLGIILVTIFLYVSYYTTPMSAVDSRYIVSSQEPRNQPPVVAAIPLVANISGIGMRELQQQPMSPEESDRIVAPSEVVGNGRNPPNETNKAHPKVAGESKINFTDFEHRLKGDVSIIIPKVETQPKQDILSKLLNQNATKVSVATNTSRNKLTGEVYEQGFMGANSELCPRNGEDINLLAVIHSAPSHVEARYAIRQTWGHYGSRRDIAIGFIVGRTSNETWEANLSSEQFMYGDIIRGNFLDSYENLTLKTISMLEWTDTYCGHAKFLLKVDDDMFINIPKLLEFTQRHRNHTRHIFGRLAKKWRPIRNKKSKYYVSPALYAPKNFPDFVTGPSYLLTTDMLRDMYEASLQHVFLKLEDVYMTGIISEKVGVKRKHVNEFLNRRIAFNPCAIRKAISIHMVKGKEQFDLWKKLLDVDLKCK